MQPEEQNSTVPQPPKEGQVTEMYTPAPTSDTPLPAVPTEPAVVTPNTDSTNPDPKPSKEPVHWQATEYVHSEKTAIWYILFIIVAVCFIAFDIFFIKSYTFSVLVIVMVIAMFIYSRRPPHMVDYTLSGSQGLYVGEKLYHFSEFKAFGLIQDINQHSIMLIPIKRFSPGVSVYFPEEVGEQVVDILGARLPMENLKPDMLDVIVHKLHL